MPPVSPGKAALVLLGLALIAAGLLTRFDLRLASSQAVVLTAKETAERVPLDDPWDPVWEEAAPMEIPLSAQQTTPPMGGGAIKTVTARALHDHDRIYFLLEWKDETQDMAAFAPQDFRDAAAVQFPADGVRGIPAFCMGQPDGHVNIWHWKADWQADIEAGFINVPQQYPNAHIDLYPLAEEKAFNPGLAVGNLFSRVNRESPVENLMAGGFGTLTSAENQMVDGKGVWRDGTWRVLFARDMQVNGGYPPFKAGQKANIAFAVWDGSAGERDGMKSVSQFADLEVAGKPRPEDVARRDIILVATLMGMFLAVVSVGGFYVWRRRRAGVA